MNIPNHQPIIYRINGPPRNLYGIVIISTFYNIMIFSLLSADGFYLKTEAHINAIFLTSYSVEMLLMFINYYTFIRYLSNKYRRFETAQELARWKDKNPIEKYGLNYLLFWIGITLRIILFVFSLGLLINNVSMNYCLYLHVGSMILFLCCSMIALIAVLIYNIIDVYRFYNKRRISASIVFQVSQDIECPICMDYDNKVGIVLNECGHKFHDGCIREWIKIKQECPVCRNGIMC